MSAYTEGNVKNEGEGVTRFTSCFKNEAGKCFHFAFGKRDAFRKLRFYTPGPISDLSGATLCPFVKSYISVPDNKLPALFLKPCFFGKNGWLFMEKVAVMADGDVVFERDFSRDSVERNAESYGVEEIYHLLATEKEIEALRKVAGATEVLVRITGQKGYVSLKKNDVKSFKEELTSLLYIYDTLKKAVEEHLPPEQAS